LVYANIIKEIAENKSAGVVNVNSSIELSKLSNNYHPKKEMVYENLLSIFSYNDFVRKGALLSKILDLSTA